MELIFWIGFFVLISVMLAVDLGIFHSEAHVVELKEATIWTIVWIGTALLFNVFVWALYEWSWLGMGESLSGNQAALQYFTAYLIEKSLSLDNIFVMALVFEHFKIRREFQHRLLFWGVLGAIVMRVTLIAIGVALIQRFEWMTIVFGFLLLVAAGRMLFHNPEDSNPADNWLVKLIRRRWKVETNPGEAHLFVKRDGEWAVTTLFLALMVVESADLLFAVDSIPAVFGVTTEPFIAITSNVLAILGLRALYFVLAGLLARIHYLTQSLVLVLLFVAVKLLIEPWIHIPILVSLGVVATILTGGGLLSLFAARSDEGSSPGGEG